MSTYVISSGIQAAVNSLVAGDTLLLRGGTYDEGISSSPSGTSWSNKIRIANYPGETVWLTPLSDSRADGMVVEFLRDEHYIEFDGINFDGRNVSRGVFNGISFDGDGDPHHIRVMNGENIARSTDQSSTSTFAQWGIGFGGHGASVIIGGNEVINMTIHGGGRPGTNNPDNGYGVYLAGPNNLVERCNIYDPKGIGVHIYNGAGLSPDNNIVRNNRIHDITRWSVEGQVQGILIVGNNNQIYNNLIYNIQLGTSAGNSGIALTGSGNKIWNNTIYNCLNGIYVDPNAVSPEFTNDIIYASANNDLAGGSSSSVFTTNLIGTDPLFVNAAGADFHLQSTSPARDTGTTVASVTTDLDGASRPQGPAYDIGAFEYESTVSSSLTATGGSYTMSGTALTFRIATPAVISANSGTYTMTGTDASLVPPAVTVTADSGSYVMTGTATTLGLLNVVADAGVYVLTGTDTTLVADTNHTLVPDEGTYTMTGTAATFITVNFVLTASGIAYAMNGTSAILGSATLTAAAGSYAMSGTDVTLTATTSQTMTASSGTYTMSGTAASFSSTSVAPPVAHTGHGRKMKVPVDRRQGPHCIFVPINSEQATAGRTVVVYDGEGYTHR